MNIVAGEGKKREIWASHPSGPHPSSPLLPKWPKWHSALPHWGLPKKRLAQVAIGLSNNKGWPKCQVAQAGRVRGGGEEGDVVKPGRGVSRNSNAVTPESRHVNGLSGRALDLRRSFCSKLSIQLAVAC